MCLSQAKGYPADLEASMPAVEQARQDMFKWASLLCSGSQPERLPAVELDETLVCEERPAN
jgi:hypothetical protein